MPLTVIGLMLLPGRRALGGRPPLTFRSISVSLDLQINFVTSCCSSNAQPAQKRLKFIVAEIDLTTWNFHIKKCRLQQALS